MFCSSRYKMAKRHKKPVSKEHKKYCLAHKKLYIKNVRKSFN